MTTKNKNEEIINRTDWYNLKIETKGKLVFVSFKLKNKTYSGFVNEKKFKLKEGKK